MTWYSHQNSLIFGYGDRELGERREGDALWYQFSKATRQPISFADECKRTAKLVHEEAQALNRPVYVLLSGGLDSAIMVKGFKAAGVPFRTATYEFINGMNEQEMQYIRPFVQREQLDAVFMQMDGVKWLKSDEAHDWFHQTYSHELGCLPLMKLMEYVWEDLGGFPVFGGGDMDIIKMPDGSWQYGRYESFLSRYWFSKLKGIENFVSFFQHTPEITLSILNDPLIRRAATGQDAIANKVLKELKAVKFNVYHRDFPDLRRRIKFGGTELIHHHIARTELEWQKERRLSYGEVWTVPYQELVDLLTPSSSAAAGA